MEATESYVATPSSLPLTELSLSDHGHNVRFDHASGTLQFVDDPFAGSDDQQVSPLSHGIVVQPSAASLVRTCLGGIASASNHARDILDHLPVPSAEEQRARVAALITAADAERKTLQLRPAIVARRRELFSERCIKLGDIHIPGWRMPFSQPTSCSSSTTRSTTATSSMPASPRSCTSISPSVFIGAQMTTRPRTRAMCSPSHCFGT